MRSLNEQQIRFVKRYVLNGGNGASAARSAGYPTSTARQTAYRLTHLQHVAAAIKAETKRKAASPARLSLKAMKRILIDPATDPQVVVDLTMNLIDRTKIGVANP